MGLFRKRKRAAAPPPPAAPPHSPRVATREEVFASNYFFSSLTGPFRAAVLALFDDGVEVRQGQVIEDGDGRCPLRLFGRFTSVLATWTAWPHHASGVLMLGDVLGANHYVGDADQRRRDPPLVCAEVLSPIGTMYSASPERVEALLAGPFAKEFTALLRNLARSQWLAAAPALEATLNSLRAELASLMEDKVVEAGKVLVDHGEQAAQLLVITPYGRVRVERRKPDGTPLPSLEFGPGCSIPAGIRSLNGVTTRVVTLERTAYSVLSAVPFTTRAWRKTDPLAVEIRRLHDLVQGILDHGEFIVDALAADPLFHGVPRGLLFLLLQAAWLVPWRATLPAPSPIGDVPGVCVVLKGWIFSFAHVLPSRPEQLATSGPVFEPLQSFGVGAVFGQRSVLENDALLAHWQARLGSEVAFINAKRLDDVLGNEACYCANLDRGQDALDYAAGLEPLRAADRPALILAARSDGGAWTEGLRLLVRLALERGRNSFRERSILVSWGTEQRRDSGPGDVWAWTEVAPSTREGWCNLLWDLSDRAKEVHASNVVFEPPPDGRHAQDSIGPALTRLLLVNITGQDAPHPHWPLRIPIVHAYFMEGAAARIAAGFPEYPLCSQRIAMPHARLVGAARQLLDDPDARLAVVAHAPEHPEWGELLRVADRLSRLLTHRSVGLALSGGEAWGFAHLAFVHALEYARIPIDMVAGASSGAVLGTCYSIGGIGSMHEFMEKIATERGMLIASCFTSVFFEDWLTRLWKGVRLEDLELPVLPVATNIELSCPEPVLHGPAATANRLSGSFVPSYPSTPTLRGTFVDGAYSANLPADVLPAEGMRLIIASNAMSPTANLQPNPSRFPGRLGLVLSDLNPIRRALATWEGALTLAYTSGTQGSRVAARTFQAVRTDVSLMDISASSEVEKLAFAQPTLWDTVLGAYAHWLQVCLPRIECPAITPPESYLRPRRRKA